MWIRSGDKSKLIDIKFVRVTVYSKAELPNCDVEGYMNNFGWVQLGKYSTKEKALKVLDMIENIIDEQEEFKVQGEEKHNNTSYKRLIKFVFQMPTDEEIKQDE